MLRSSLRQVWRRDDAPAGFVVRVDRYALRIDASSIVKHANGWVDAWGVATRVGVFVYDDEDRPGEILREWRPPDEVLRQDSLATLVGVPFTIDHPAGAVDSANFRDLTHGHVLAVRVDGDLVWAQIRIASDQAKAAIEAGTIELSCGYRARLDETPGITPRGEPFDAVQRDITYNHLALVDLARAGHVARLHLDHGGRVQRTDQARRGVTDMKRKIRIDGKTYSVPDMLVAGISALAEQTAKTKRKGDAIETAEATFITPEGEVKLILPLGAVEEMLAMIGAVESPSADPAPVDADPADPTKTDPAAGGPPPAGQTPPRMDAAAFDKAVQDAVGKAIATALPKALQAREDRARERSELERRCAPHLEAGYRFADADDIEIVLDAIEAVDAPRLDSAKALAAKARKGDERARGRLDAMLDELLDRDRDRADATGDAIGRVFEIRQGAAEQQQALASASGMTRADRARADRIAKITGAKPTTTETADK